MIKAMKRFTSTRQRTGEMGEHIACMYIKERGYTIVERNHTRKWGEIDIIARKGDITHFIEVKSVSRESGLGSPEENMHVLKQRKLARTIAVYVAFKDVGKWQCDLICVLLNNSLRKAEVRLFEDIILEN